MAAFAFSAGTNKYAYDQGFDASSLQHRRPLLITRLWWRLQEHRARVGPTGGRGPVELMP